MSWTDRNPPPVDPPRRLHKIVVANESKIGGRGTGVVYRAFDTVSTVGRRSRFYGRTPWERIGLLGDERLQSLTSKESFRSCYYESAF